MKTLPPTVKKFLSDNILATIATISQKDDYPYVLPVFYITDDDASHLYFATHKESRKFKNILFHPHIGISITNSATLMSLQLQGPATIAEQDSEIIEKLLASATRNSGNALAPLMQIADSGTMVLLTFSIHWYRLAGYEGDMPLFIEGTLE